MTAVSDETCDRGPELLGSDSALSVRNLWKIFGARADKIIGTPDATAPAQRLKEKTGRVAGIRTSASRSPLARSSW